VGELGADPFDRMGRKLGFEGSGPRVPTVEAGMMMRAIEAADRAVDALQEVGPPDRAGDMDRLGGIDGSLDRRPLEHAHLEPDAALGAFLAGIRIRIEEVEVAD